MITIALFPGEKTRKTMTSSLFGERDPLPRVYFGYNWMPEKAKNPKDIKPVVTKVIPNP